MSVWTWLPSCLFTFTDMPVMLAANAQMQPTPDAAQVDTCKKWDYLLMKRKLIQVHQACNIQTEKGSTVACMLVKIIQQFQSVMM